MSSTPRKEWFGESGYCNCLLVAMSRAGVRHVELRSDQPPPHLGDLVRDHPSTEAWIGAQQFDYGSLDTRQVIITLAGMAGIYRAFWKPKTGVMKVVDVVAEEGTTVERAFDLHLKGSRRRYELEVTQRGQVGT